MVAWMNVGIVKNHIPNLQEASGATGKFRPNAINSLRSSRFSM